jgi:hypothetical protein
MKLHFIFSSFSLLMVSVGLLIIGAEMVRVVWNYSNGMSVILSVILILGAVVVTSYIIIRSYEKEN